LKEKNEEDKVEELRGNTKLFFDAIWRTILKNASLL